MTSTNTIPPSIIEKLLIKTPDQQTILSEHEPHEIEECRRMIEGTRNILQYVINREMSPSPSDYRHDRPHRRELTEGEFLAIGDGSAGRYDSGDDATARAEDWCPETNRY